MLVGTKPAQDKEPLWVFGWSGLSAIQSTAFIQTGLWYTGVLPVFLSRSVFQSPVSHTAGVFSVQRFPKAGNTWVFWKAHLPKGMLELILVLVLDLCCWLPWATSLICYGVPTPYRLVLGKLCTGEMQPDCLVYEIMVLVFYFSAVFHALIYIYFIQLLCLMQFFMRRAFASSITGEDC